MIVETKHGEFEVKDITRTERRLKFKKVKAVFASADVSELHDLGDEFAELAFDDPDQSLGGLSALEEDQVLLEIISQYMGFDLKNATGD